METMNPRKERSPRNNTQEKRRLKPWVSQQRNFLLPGRVIACWHTLQEREAEPGWAPAMGGLNLGETAERCRIKSLGQGQEDEGVWCEEGLTRADERVVFLSLFLCGLLE